MKKRNYKYFVGDFETTVFEGQTYTEVWASACVELYTDDVKIFHSIGEQFDYFKSLDCDIICYYHNLKFDGMFWLDYLLRTEHFKQAYRQENSDDINTIKWVSSSVMPNNSIIYSISDMGQWYRVIIKVNNRLIELRDSLKLLPFSVKRIGQSFETRHKKLDMEYKGVRYAGCVITDEEQHYIKNDVLVIKEALEIMFQEGHNRLTIGSCCLFEYRKSVGKNKYKELFPNMYEMPIDENLYGVKTVGDYIHKSYHGGWCYLVRGKENKIYHNGTTADVNSLYPSMMSSESGNAYPVGYPEFWKGNYIPKEAQSPGKYFFIRIRTRFYIKEDKLPFIQIKGTLRYKFNEMLETSDVYNHADGKYYRTYLDYDGKEKQAIVTLTLTMVDFKLLLEHYNLEDFEILDGCYFESRIGIFDEYIDKYKELKLTSTGAKRELAKLFLNNLYGKMASSPASSFKVAYIREDKSIGFYTVIARDKIPGYIPVGSAITSYARNFTIRHAQKNYHGKENPGFIYADTDSIHCDVSPDELIGIKEHSKNFCCWKLESCWDNAIFVRQKTYIEHITHENREPIDKPYYNVKCAGMPDRCKNLFIKSIEGYTPNENDDYTQEEQDFMQINRTIEDFKIGLVVPGKLLPKKINGGIVLQETTYQMR